MGREYTEEQIEWIKGNRSGNSYQELTELFNERFGTNRTFNGIKTMCTHRLHACDTHEPYTKEQDEWLIENALKYNNYAEVAEEFNKLFGTNKVDRGIQSHCVRVLNIISGRQSKAPSGWNKQPIGAELLTKEGYTLVKINDTGIKNKDWITKQRYIYEQHYGKIGDTDIVVFLDGDKSNYSLDNLEAIPRAISLRINANKWNHPNKEFTLAAIRWCELYYVLKAQGAI